MVPGQQHSVSTAALVALALVTSTSVLVLFRVVLVLFAVLLVVP